MKVDVSALVRQDVAAAAEQVDEILVDRLVASDCLESDLVLDVLVVDVVAVMVVDLLEMVDDSVAVVAAAVVAMVHEVVDLDSDLSVEVVEIAAAVLADRMVLEGLMMAVVDDLVAETELMAVAVDYR